MLLRVPMSESGEHLLHALLRLREEYHAMGAPERFHELQPLLDQLLGIED